MTIGDTKAFNALDPLVQKLLLKRVNRVQIEDQIVIARNMDLEQWKKQSPLQPKWNAIVIEIIESE